MTRCLVQCRQVLCRKAETLIGTELSIAWRTDGLTNITGTEFFPWFLLQYLKQGSIKCRLWLEQEYLSECLLWAPRVWTAAWRMQRSY